VQLPCPGRDGLRPTTPLYLRTSPGRCAPRSGRRPVGERPPRGSIWLRERRQRRPARAGTGCARCRSELSVGPVTAGELRRDRAHLGVSARGHREGSRSAQPDIRRTANRRRSRRIALVIRLVARVPVLAQGWDLPGTNACGASVDGEPDFEGTGRRTCTAQRPRLQQQSARCWPTQGGY
jgi:hypothetical protein